MKEANEKVTVTGLDQAENRKEAEYDLVTSLLEAAEFKTSEENIVELEVVRKSDKKFLFSFRVHPLSDADTRIARKKSTTYMRNPNNPKLPRIEKERNEVLFKSWIIYLATVEEDQQKIWGNPVIMQKYGLMEPVESIDILLPGGDKDRFFDEIGKISGFDDEDDAEDGDESSESMDEVEYAKN